MNDANAEWFYASNGQQFGPVTLAALDALSAEGHVGPETLVWSVGMTDWAEARALPEFADAWVAGKADGTRDESALLQTPAPVPLPRSHNWPAPASQTVLTHGVLAYHAHTPPLTVHYAGFWIRFVAAIVDSLLMRVVSYGVGYVIGVTVTSIMSTAAGAGGSGGSGGGQPGIPPHLFVAAALGGLAGLIIEWQYHALLTASAYQATLGKLVVGVKIVGLQGERISFGRATGRHFAKYLSAVLIGIGYIIAAFDERKRSLHDQICKTLVVYK